MGEEMKDMHYIRELLEGGQRADGRKLDEFRNVELHVNPYDKPEGCAIVSIGESKVIAGVKMGIGEPFPDRPDEGVLMVNAELSPLASPDFETGPPSVESIELARVVDRGIRESGTLDLKKLCLIPKEQVWLVCVDIQIINHDGNLIDAAALASIAALHNARMPEYKDEIINYDKKTVKLPVKAKPVAVTVSKFGQSLLLDASLTEEKLVTAAMVVATNEEGHICALQKRGTEGFTEEEILRIWDIAAKKGKELRKLL